MLLSTLSSICETRPARQNDRYCCVDRRVWDFDGHLFVVAHWEGQEQFKEMGKQKVWACGRGSVDNRSKYYFSVYFDLVW